MKQKVIKPEPRGRISTEDGDAKMRLFAFQFGAVFNKPPNKMPIEDQHILKALGLYYSYRHNGYLLIEALTLCTDNKANPPIWVLESINDGLVKFVVGNVTLNRALALTKRHLEEYKQYRTEHAVMGAVRERINQDPKRKIAPACNYVAGKYGWTPQAAEKAYRRFWKGFFDYVSNNKPRD